VRKKARNLLGIVALSSIRIKYEFELTIALHQADESKHHPHHKDQV